MKLDLKITTGVAAALLVSGCGQRDNGWTATDNTAICTDRQGNRVPDAECQRHVGGGGMGTAFLWYYLGRNSVIPYYGQHVGGGSFRPAAGAAYARAPAGSAMTRSAAISRGGFGSSARGFGGFGGGAGE
ncbi:hypothetical protein [uncultured Sphingomonas sp.]|uniref:hypothetical protein n=1 Tax=uncultured Sphingomonas sp. TaxID=158754 RepID=UPI0035C9FF74